MIFDCFPFFNEFDLLEIRLEELDMVVDFFVLVESPLTHSGKDKPMFFLENKHRFERWLPKIRHLVVDPITGEENRWQREHQQRDWVVRGFDDARDSDLIISSDLDEIVSASSFERSVYYCQNLCGDLRPLHVQQRAYYYYFNLRWRLDLFSACIGGAGYFRQKTPTDWRYGPIIRDEIIQDGGWHFTYMGGRDAVISKMESFVHGPEQTNCAVVDLIRVGKPPELVGQDRVYEVKIDPSFPKSIYEQQEKWIDRGFIKPNPFPCS